MSTKQEIIIEDRLLLSDKKCKDENKETENVCVSPSSGKDSKVSVFHDELKPVINKKRCFHENCNKRIAKIIGIKSVARCTTVKPAGTTSLTLGTSSGIHPWHGEYYLRRVRVGKNESIYTHLLIHHPELIEDEYFRPHDTAVIEIPQSAPKGSILRTESAFDLLERVKKVATEWVQPGHRAGNNTHNVSATISLKQQDWDKAGEWMWKNRDCYNGLSVLPYDGGTYTQAPFEDIKKSEFDKLVKSLHDVDITKIKETTDQTDLSGELACAGGSCEVTGL